MFSFISYHKFTNDQIYTRFPIDGLCLFSRLELTVHAIDRMAFLIEFICWSYIFTGLWGKENYW